MGFRQKASTRGARLGRSGVVSGLLALGAASLLASQAAAQHYNVIGQSGPAVVVDTSVLDELGPPNNIGAATSAEAAANRFGPGVLVRTTKPASAAGTTGAAKVPPSRLIAVPALAGRPTPQIGGRSGLVRASSDSSPMPAAPPPRQASAPPAQTAAVPKPPAPPAPPPRQVSAPPPSPPPAMPAAPAPTTAATPPTPPAAPPPPPAPTPAPPVAAAPPAPAAAPPVPTPTPPQTAALPPAASAAGASAGRLSFEGGSAALSESARQELDKMASTLAGNEQQRLQVVAFAASQGNTSAARRLSLSRALAVRSYLIDKGIRSTRIDVRAMGTPEGASAGPSDRVDLVLVGQ